MSRDYRRPILTGFASRRAAGVRKELVRRAALARLAAMKADDERFAASMRGKARAYGEAVDLVRALETGRRIGKLRRQYDRSEA